MKGNSGDRDIDQRNICNIKKLLKLNHNAGVDRENQGSKVKSKEGKKKVKSPKMHKK